MENLELIPNESYANFIIGDNIENYFHLPHVVEHYHDEKPHQYDSYYFYESKLSLWIEDNKIAVICCDEECYWRGRNLLGLLYESFLDMVGQQPDEEDTLYVLVSENRGQNQKVYDFDSLGLQIWVWRKKIVTVLVSRYDDEDDVISSEIGIAVE